MAGRSPTVLITDDAKVNRLLVQRCLQGQGYQFLEAANGHEALEKLRTTRVDLVILDLMMPVLDGFAFLEQVHTDAQLSSIPVIVNSSLVRLSSPRTQNCRLSKFNGGNWLRCFQ